MRQSPTKNSDPTYIISVFLAIKYKLMTHLGNLEKKATMRLLIVDDSEIIRERLKTVLSEVPKVETISQAKDQQEARELMGKLNPDVVIVDIQMPGGSGINLLREVKKGQKPPMLIVLTNQSYPQYRRKCMEAGVDFFFDKSTEFDKIAEVLKQLI